MIPDEEIAAIFGTRRGRPAVRSLYAPVASATAGVWHVQHNGKAAVLKVLCPAVASGDSTWRAEEKVTDSFWWRREAAVFEEGALASLPADGVSVPTCFGVFDRADGTTAIWMEDLSGGTPATRLDPVELLPMLRQLGRTQAACIDAHWLEAPSWSRGWLDSYVRRHAEGLEIFDDPSAAAHPLLAGLLDPEDVAEVRSVWDSVDLFLEWASVTPRTLAHFDLTPKNLFRRQGEFVAIDWAFAGHAGLGVDSGPFFVNAAGDFQVQPDDVTSMIAAGNAEFAAGLRDGGLEFDTAQLELAASAAAAVKFAWLLTAVLTATVSNWPTFNGRPLTEGMTWWARLAPVLAERARAARRLGAGAS